MNSEHQSLVAHATEVLALAKGLSEKNHAVLVSDLKGKVFAAEVKIGELEQLLSQLLSEARERELDRMPRRETREMQQRIEALGKLLRGAQHRQEELAADAEKYQDVMKDLRAQLAFEKTRADGNWAQSEKWRAQCSKAHAALRQTYRVALETVYVNNSQNTGKDVL